MSDPHEPSEVEVVEIGGEMPHWGDGPLPDDPVVARVVAHLVQDGRSVLVAGPTGPDVLRAAASGGGEVTVLTRGRPDAEAAGLVLGAPAHHLLAGDLARLDPARRFGVVVAAGGLETLSGADAPLRTWGELLGLLVRHVDETGSVLLGLAADVGLDALSGGLDRQRDDGAAAWFPDLGFDDTRPTDADGLLRALRDGLGRDGGPGAVWSLVPGLRSPGLAVASAVEVHGRNLLTSRVAAALRRAHPDPRGLATRVPVSGRLHLLAPALLAVVGTAVPADLDVLAATGDFAPDRPGPAASDADRPGSSAELALLDACLAFDLPRVRAVVERYASVLAAGSTTTDLPAEVFLADDGGSQRLGAPGEPTPVADALLRGLDAFSCRLSELGWRHPWPVTYDDVDITRVLLAGTGRGIDRAHVIAARAGSSSPREGEDAAPSRLRREMDGLRSREEWFETTLRQRDRQLAAANARLARVATPAQRRQNREGARPAPAPPSLLSRARRVAGRLRRRLAR